MSSLMTLLPLFHIFNQGLLFHYGSTWCALVPPSVEPTYIEQPLVQSASSVFPTLQEMETMLPSHEGEAD
eukprot:1258004-Ditylum_brightwellii.AAC.1